MLKTFRKGADGFLAKLLMVFLVATFALWGIGDVFRGAPENVIATVADNPITLAQLEDTMRQEQARIPQLTAELAQSLPVRLQLLNRIINSRLLEAEAKAIGLHFSQDALSDSIAQNPLFHNEEGQFSSELFLAILQQNNLTQSTFVQQIKNDERIQLLSSAVGDSLQATQQMADIYAQIETETREASLILLTTEEVTQKIEPSSEELSAHYSQIREMFRVPEYRTYRYVFFDAEGIAKREGLTPSTQEIADYYTQQYGEQPPADAPSLQDATAEISSLLTQEVLSPRLAEISNTLDDATAGGASLEEALSIANLADLHIETLGPITANNMLKNGEVYSMKPYEQEILQSAFELEAGEIAPMNIAADGRYFLVETLEVIASHITPLEAVSEQVAEHYIAAQKQQQLQQQAHAFAAELQQSEAPRELAKSKGYALHSTGAITRHHDTISNRSKLKDKILPSELVLALFALKPHEVSDAFALPSGEMAIGILDRITPSKPKAETIAQLQQSLTQQLQLQATNAYLTALRDKYKVEIFMDKIATSATAGEQ